MKLRVQSHLKHFAITHDPYEKIPLSTLGQRTLFLPSTIRYKKVFHNYQSVRQVTLYRGIIYPQSIPTSVNMWISLGIVGISFIYYITSWRPRQVLTLV